MTQCFRHLALVEGRGRLNGVVRVAGDVTWTSDGQTLTITFPGVGAFGLPAAPGHYQMRPAPGINNELQINLVR